MPPKELRRTPASPRRRRPTPPSPAPTPPPPTATSLTTIYCANAAGHPPRSHTDAPNPPQLPRCDREKKSLRDTSMLSEATSPPQLPPPPPRPPTHATCRRLDAIPRPGPLMPPDAPQLPRSAPLMLIHTTASTTPETPLVGNEGPIGLAHLLFAETNFHPVQRLSVLDQQVCESTPFFFFDRSQ